MSDNEKRSADRRHADFLKRLPVVGCLEFFEFVEKLERRGIKQLTVFAISPDHKETDSETLYLWQLQAMCAFVNEWNRRPGWKVGCTVEGGAV
jgi:hypothetical protein